MIMKMWLSFDFSFHIELLFENIVLGILQNSNMCQWINRKTGGLLTLWCSLSKLLLQYITASMTPARFLPLHDAIMVSASWWLHYGFYLFMTPLWFLPLHDSIMVSTSSYSIMVSTSSWHYYGFYFFMTPLWFLLLHDSIMVSTSSWRLYGSNNFAKDTFNVDLQLRTSVGVEPKTFTYTWLQTSCFILVFG